jgi:hypothetical protein
MLERSSNEIVERFFPGTVLPKPVPDTHLSTEAENGLPVAGEFIGVVGTGDFDHRKSVAGSVILGHENGVVVKVPIGEVTEDAFVRSARMQSSVRNFSGVSPETLIIITRADGEAPKPVVLQKEVKGKPLCDAPISALLKLETLQDIRKIVSMMREWYWEKGAYDLCGQRTSNSLWGRLTPFAPSLSDNIMIDSSGHACLVDNILDATVKVDTPKRKYKDFIRKNILHKIPLVIIDTIIVARRLYEYFNKSNGGVSERIDDHPVDVPGGLTE